MTKKLLTELLKIRLDLLGDEIKYQNYKGILLVCDEIKKDVQDYLKRQEKNKELFGFTEF